MQSQNLNSARFLNIILHLGFFLSGISTVLIGQVLPILSTRLALNDEQAGNLFIAQFSGSLIGTLLTNWFGRRNKFLSATILGCFLMGAGILFLNSDLLFLCFTGFILNGLGIGLTLPSINMLIIEFNPLKSASALNILNFFWGLGAILSQPFIDLLSRGTNIRLPTLMLSAPLILISAAIVFISRGVGQKSAASQESMEDISAPIWTNPLAWMIALFNFIHVGFESGMGGWLKTYTNRVENAEVLSWLPPIFLYFLFFVVGRGVAPVFFRFLNENKMLILSLLVILLGMGVLLFAKNGLFLSIGASIAGFGTSSVFPTNLARFTKTFGPTAIKRATPFFICGTLGATFITWIIGYISNYFNNNLRSGMFALLACILALIALQIPLGFQKRQEI